MADRIEDADELAELADYLSEDEEDEIDEEVPLNKDLSNVILVSGLPSIPEAKAGKLKSVIFRIYSQFGQIDAEEGCYMPFSDEGKSFGFCFLEFADAKTAKVAAQSTDGYKLDKRHSFKVMLCPDLQALRKVPETFPEPVAPEFNRDGLFDWLTDSNFRDQLLIRHSSETEVHWGEAEGPPTLEYGGARQKKEGMVWCDMFAHWSPQGAFLATMHKEGIALWGGPSFSKLMRLRHPGVWELEFSPCERYLLTWDGRTGDAHKTAIIVWDTRTGAQLRAFAHPGAPAQLATAAEGTTVSDTIWPHFKWSGNGKYLARVATDCQGLQVYELPSMRLLGKQKIRAYDIGGFSWAPMTPGKPNTDETPQLLAYWTRENANRSAAVSIVSVPSRQIVASKNLFLVTNIDFYWQNIGEFLSCVVTRYTKSKTRRPGPTQIELFRVCDKSVPVEQMEVTGTVRNFAWEPTGVRFGLVQGESSHKCSIGFYTMGKAKGGRAVKSLVTMEDKEVNTLHWSPRGHHVVMSGQGAVNGPLEWYDVDRKRSLATATQFMCNRVQWDPAGRVVITAVATPLFGGSMRHDLESGYSIWTFQGALVNRCQLPKLYQLTWRPRPLSLLSAAEKSDIETNLKKYISKYEEHDRQRSRESKKVKKAQRQDRIREFQSRLRAYRSVAVEYEATRAQREWEVVEDDLVEEIIEVVMSISEQVMNTEE